MSASKPLPKDTSYISNTCPPASSKLNPKCSFHLSVVPGNPSGCNKKGISPHFHSSESCRIIKTLRYENNLEIT
ncbi:At-Rich Interactive Domain-Containing Protein 1B [Manis pentadactyla]|nr:At-Rich Interactive Domain-Containing Protein 1B [Manis pentadactyla]